MQAHIEWNGTKDIVLPEGMTHDEAINRISTHKELQNYGEKPVTIEEVIPRFPFEAAHALSKAVKELHGTSIGHDIPLPDGTAIENKLIGVPISTTESIQVPWGPFHLPDVEGDFQTRQVIDNGMVVMMLVAKVKRKYQERIKKLADRTRELASSESIYRGKAIKVRFRNSKGELDVVPPEFMDLSGDHEVIFSDDVMEQIKFNLIVPITKAALAKEIKVPTKRGVLLYGTYGSGKTLTARWIAKLATALGRTFIYVRNAVEFADALRFAAQYEPAIIFAEDIDRVMFGIRTAEMDQILNTVDGVDTKNLDVITVLTTNNLNMIHPAFLREGRTDTIIQIDQPDSRAIERLIRRFSEGLLDENERITPVIGKLQGRTPAFIRAVIEKSKLRMLADHEGDTVEGLKVSGKDLEIAANDHIQERAGVEVAMRESERVMRLIQQIREAGGDAVLQGGMM